MNSVGCEIDRADRRSFLRGRSLYALEVLTFLPTALRYLLRRDRRSAGRGLRACREAARAFWGRSTGAASRVCPLCGWKGSRFGPVYYYHEYREDARCPGCGSYERHRSLMLLIRTYLSAEFDAARRVLDIAPSAFSRAFFPARADYLSFDLKSRLAMVHGDLTHAPLPSESFDLWMCLHVLDVIPDDAAAMRELHRVLRPGGLGIIDHAMRWDGPTEEFGGPRADASNKRRRYGTDLPERLRAAGFAVEVIDMSDWSTAEARSCAGLSPRRFLLCRPNT